ncbi:MAG: dihydrofolate reductase, partial [Alphaproteobacteria bacterium]
MDLGRPLVAIAALGRNRAIGKDNRLPWRLPGDLAFFKATTLGQVLVMGRRTHESIGRPLPGRLTVVLSRSGFTAPGVTVLPSWEALREVAPDR